MIKLPKARNSKEQHRCPPTPGKKQRLLWSVIFCSVLASSLGFSILLENLSKLAATTVQAYLTTALSCTVNVEAIQIQQLFPRPIIQLEKVRLANDRFDLQTTKLLAKPGFVSIFTKSLQWEQLDLFQPEIHLRETAAVPSAQSTDTSNTAFEHTKHLLLEIAGQLPSRQLRLHNGQLEYTSTNAHIHAQQLEVLLTTSREASTQLGSLQFHAKQLQLTDTALQDIRFHGRFQMTSQQLFSRVDEFSIGEDGLQLTGTFSATSQAATATLKSQQLDLKHLKKTAEKFFPKTDRLNQLLVHVPTGILEKPEVVVSGATFAEFADAKNYRFSGQLVNGTVALDGLHANLEKTAGQLEFHDLKLTGTGLRTQLLDAVGTNGQLRLDFSTAIPELVVDAEVRTELQHLPSLLAALVDSEALDTEVQKFSKPQGACLGSLQVSGEITALKTQFQIKKIDGRLQHQSVPAPFRIAAGRVTVTASTIQLVDFDVFSDSFQITGLNTTTQLLTSQTTITAKQATIEAAPHAAQILDAFQLPKSTTKLLSGKIALQNIRAAGRFSQLSAMLVSATGRVENLAIVSSKFPDFKSASCAFQLTDARFQLQKCALATETFSGVVEGSVSSSAVQLHGAGLLKTAAIPQAFTKFNAILPTQFPEIVFITNLQASGPVSNLEFSGTGQKTLKDTLKLEAAGAYVKNQLRVRTLRLHDQLSDVTVQLPETASAMLSLSGELHSETVKKLLQAAPPASGKIAGQLQCASQQFPEISCTGKVQSDSLQIRSSERTPTQLKKLVVDVSTSALHATAESAQIGSLVLHAPEASARLAQKQLQLHLDSAAACGFQVTGDMTATSERITTSATLTGSQLDAAAVARCAFKKETALLGTLSGTLQLHEVLSLETETHTRAGDFHLVFENGSIRQNPILGAFLEVLNAPTVLADQSSKLTAESLQYASTKLDGTITDSTLHFSAIALTGKTAEIVGLGDWNYATNALDLELLVAPFRTVDLAIKNLPGISQLLNGRLLTIPVHVSGTTTAPSVSPLRPDVLSKSLVNLATRTLTFPFTFFQSLQLPLREQTERGK